MVLAPALPSPAASGAVYTTSDGNWEDVVTSWCNNL
jgi:hypothetical protein